jgi:hypothetical protein
MVSEYDWPMWNSANAYLIANPPGKTKENIYLYHNLSQTHSTFHLFVTHSYIFSININITSTSSRQPPIPRWTKS